MYKKIVYYQKIKKNLKVLFEARLPLILISAQAIKACSQTAQQTYNEPKGNAFRLDVTKEQGQSISPSQVEDVETYNLDYFEQIGDEAIRPPIAIFSATTELDIHINARLAEANSQLDVLIEDRDELFHLYFDRTLNYELTDVRTYNIRISAVNDKNIEIYNADFVVTLKDENEKPEFFISGLTISEKQDIEDIIVGQMQQQGYVIGTIALFDPDVENQNFQRNELTIAGIDRELVGLTDSNQLYLKDKPNAEIKNKYNITITARDRDETGVFEEQNLVITIMDEDEAPFFESESNQQIFINENTLIDQVLYEFVVKDEDDFEAEFGYKIEGRDKDYFYIEADIVQGQNGQIIGRLKFNAERFDEQNINYEKPSRVDNPEALNPQELLDANNYQVKIIVFSQNTGKERKENEKTIDVQIQNEYEAPIIIFSNEDIIQVAGNPNEYMITVPEGDYSRDILTYISVIVDENKQDNLEIRATLIDEDKLQFEQSGAKRLQFINIVDFENDPSSYVVQFVIDELGDPAKSTIINLSIEISDVNEEPTDIRLLNPPQGVIVENDIITILETQDTSEEGRQLYLLGEIDIIDEDLLDAYSNNFLSLEGEQSAIFEFRDNRLYLAANINFEDYQAEGGDAYIGYILFVSDDPDGLSYQKNWQIFVSDVDEEPQIITQAPEETIKIGAEADILYTFKAKDPENDALRFQVKDSHNGLFIVETHYNEQDNLYEGILKLNRNIEYDSQSDNRYQLEIELYLLEASSSLLPADAQELVIEVLDIDYQPERLKENYQLPHIMVGTDEVLVNIKVEKLISIFSDLNGREDIIKIKFLEELPQDISLGYIFQGQEQNIVPTSDEAFFLNLENIDVSGDGEKYIHLTIGPQAVPEHYQISYNVEDSTQKTALLNANIKFQVIDFTPPDIVVANYQGMNIALELAVFTTTIKERQKFIGTLSAQEDIEFEIDADELNQYLEIDAEGRIYFTQFANYESPFLPINHNLENPLRSANLYSINIIASELIGDDTVSTNFIINVLVEDIDEAPENILILDPIIYEAAEPIYDLSSGINLYKVVHLNPSGRIEILDQDFTIDFQQFNRLRVAEEYSDLFRLIPSVSQLGYDNIGYDLFMLEKPDYERISSHNLVIEIYDENTNTKETLFSKKFVIKVIDEVNEEGNEIIFSSEEMEIIEVYEDLDISKSIYNAEAFHTQGKKVYYRLDRADNRFADYFNVDRISGELTLIEQPDYEIPFLNEGIAPNHSLSGVDDWKLHNSYDITIQAFTLDAEGAKDIFENKNVKVKVKDIYDGDGQFEMSLSYVRNFHVDALKSHFANVYVYDFFGDRPFYQSELVEKIEVEEPYKDNFYVKRSSQSGVFELHMTDDMLQNLHNNKRPFFDITLSAFINDKGNLRSFSDIFYVNLQDRKNPPIMLRDEFHWGDLWIGDLENKSKYDLTYDMLKSNFDDPEDNIIGFYFDRVRSPLKGGSNIRNVPGHIILYPDEDNDENNYFGSVAKSELIVKDSVLKFLIYKETSGVRELDADAVYELTSDGYHWRHLYFKAFDKYYGVSQEEFKVTFNLVIDFEDENIAPQFVDDEGKFIYIKELYIDENLDTETIFQESLKISGIDNPRYSILQTEQALQLNIDENGTLRVTVLADYEVKKSYKATIAANYQTDALDADPVLTSILRVNIIDVNEEIDGLILSQNEILDNAKPDQEGRYIIGSLVVIEQDQKLEFLNYEFSISGDDNAFFTIENRVLYLTEKPSIEKERYSIKVTATDATLSQDFDFDIFVITSLPPVTEPVRVRILKNMGAIQLDDPIDLDIRNLLIAFEDEDETSPINALIFKYIPPNVELKNGQEQIISGDRVLIENVLQGKLTLTIPALGGQFLPFYIKYNVMDTREYQAADNSILYFNVEDSTDLLPVFTASDALDAAPIDKLEFEINENSELGILITKIFAKDTENQDEIRYKIGGGDQSELFSIDATSGELQLCPSGELQLCQSVDFEGNFIAAADQNYHVIVRASEYDQSGNENVFNDIEVNLKILDVPEPPTDVYIRGQKEYYDGTPIISTRTLPTELNINGQTHNYYFVGNLIITDQDNEDPYNSNFLEIVNGADQFFISEDKIYLKNEPQQNTVYQLTVSLNEVDGAEVLQKDLTVKFLEELEFRSSIPEYDGSRRIFENDFYQSGNIYLIGVIAGDVLIENLEITGDDAQYVSISEENGKFNVYLGNLEPDNIVRDDGYRFIIREQNSLEIISSEIILIVDEELKWSQELENQITIYGDESQIAYFNAQHDDGDTDILYALEDTTDSEYFSIEPKSGVLRLTQEIDYDLPFDENEDNIYELRITASATELGTISSISRDFNVKVDSLNKISISSTSVSEDVQAVDFGRELYYQIGDLRLIDGYPGFFLQPSGSDFRKFAIFYDGLYLAEKPDYEANIEYQVSIYFAIDEAQRQQIGKDYVKSNFVINVENVEEAPYFAEYSRKWFQIDEEAQNANIGRVEALDQENQVSYSIKDQGDDAQYFSIDEQTGDIQLSQLLDYENPSDTGGEFEGDNVYEIYVVASATEVSGKIQTATDIIHIEVKDIYDPEPNVDIPLFIHEDEATMGEIIELIYDEAQNIISYEVAVEIAPLRNLITRIDQNPLEDGQYFSLEEHSEEPQKRILTLNIDNIDFENPVDNDKDNIYKVSLIAQHADLDDNPIQNERIRQEFQFQIDNYPEAPIFIPELADREIRQVTRGSLIKLPLDFLTAAFETQEIRGLVEDQHYEKIKFLGLSSGSSNTEIYNFDGTLVFGGDNQAVLYPSLAHEGIIKMITGVDIFYFDEDGNKNILTPETNDEAQYGKEVEFIIGDADEVWLKINGHKQFNENAERLEIGKTYSLKYKAFDAKGVEIDGIAKISFDVISSEEFGFIPELALDGSILIRQLEGFEDLGGYVFPVARDVRGKNDYFNYFGIGVEEYDGRSLIGGDGIEELFVLSTKTREPDDNLYIHDDSGEFVVSVDMYTNNLNTIGLEGLAKQLEEDEFYSNTKNGQIITILNNPFATFYHRENIVNSEVVSLNFLSPIYPTSEFMWVLYGVHGEDNQGNNQDNIYASGFGTVIMRQLNSYSEPHIRLHPENKDLEYIPIYTGFSVSEEPGRYEYALANFLTIRGENPLNSDGGEDLVLPLTSYASASSYDLNSDGDEDLVLALTNGEYIYYEQEALFSFVTIPEYPEELKLKTGDDDPFSDIDLYEIDPDLSDNSHYRANSPVFFDVDRDQDADMLVGTILDDTYGSIEKGVIRYFENVGSPFSPEFVERIGAEENPFYSLAYGNGSVLTFIDIDADGDQELVIGDIEGGGLTYIENTASDETWSYYSL